MLRNLALIIPLALASTAVADRTAPRGPAGELATIQFNLASTRIPEGAMAWLTETAAWARTHSAGTILIDSYASGERAGAERIALRRAALVRDKLLDAGITSERLVITAFTTEKEAVPRVTLLVTPQPRQIAIAARKQESRLVLWGPELFSTTHGIARR